MRTTVARLVLVVACTVPAAAQEQSLEAVMPWSGEGQVFRIGPSTMIFLGSFEGIMYVETSTGAVDEAYTRCPVAQTIDLETSATHAQGYCTMTQSPDDSVFASFECDGEPGGCKGSFELTGGTGIFEDATGSSEFHVRTPLGDLIDGMADGSTIRVESGVAMLPKLTYSFPKDPS